MDWWAWVIGGAVLLGAELGLVDAQFYLVFLGSAALLVGLISASVPALTGPAQWAMFAALALVAMLGFRRRIYSRWRGQAPTLRTGPTGSVLLLPATLAPGASCQAEHGGTFWTVRNDSDVAIDSGTAVRVLSVQGLTLSVRSDSPDP